MNAGTGYIIKTTYTSGPHKGKEYYLLKGGYVTDLNNIHFDDDCYKSEAICQRVCNNLFNRNEQDIKFERYNNEWRAKQGFKPFSKFNLYEHQTYEPVKVPVVSSAL